MKRIKYSIVFLLLFVMLLPSWGLTIKIASLAPANTPWDDAMRQIAKKWYEISDGKIVVKIYPGGIAGDEIDVIRKMRLGQLQGAVLSSVGLNKIEPELMTMGLPLITQTDEEVIYLLERMGPRWSKLLEDKGMVPVAWQLAGWVSFFTRTPAYSPEELRALKLRSYPDEPEMNQTFKEFGFNVVPIPQNEVLSALQTGMVDAAYAPPVLAATLQWFGIANHYNTLRFAPVVGGLVIDKRTWNRIPQEYREDFIKAASEVAKDLNDKVIEVDKKAIEIMKQNGLIVHEATEKEIQEWQSLAKKGLDRLADNLFSRELYEEVLAVIKEYREKK
ncbi:TRAP transporter substrate-binding protein DctP [Spirochaetia bacterium 38H-sp]|uniref:TRAP transporter substrate-binding protein DctP n=1 Tax=Rarispira pelagica TaxID=3141764 RepID=A0ABU9UAH1_9SPIR